MSIAECFGCKVCKKRTKDSFEIYRKNYKEQFKDYTEELATFLHEHEKCGADNIILLSESAIDVEKMGFYDYTN